jgi:HEAT repeats
LDYKKFLPKPPPECRDPELFQLLNEYHFVRWHPDCVSQRELLLKQISSPSILARAEIAIEDPYERLRQYAGELLIWARREGAAPFILKLLDDQSEYVRGETAKLLALFRCDQCVPKLISMATKDSSAFVRGCAACGLGGQDPSSAIPVLIDILDHDIEECANGHSPSSCAATALDEMMQTEWTQKRYDGGLRGLDPAGVDLTALREQALLFLQHLRQSRHV